MIDATPSIKKKVISKKVRENAPPAGRTIKSAPTTMARIAEMRDHQKRGTPRILKVTKRPTSPLRRNNHPTTMVTARVAMGGTMTAAAPRQIRTNSLDQVEDPVLMKGRQHCVAETINAALITTSKPPCWFREGMLASTGRGASTNGLSL